MTHALDRSLSSLTALAAASLLLSTSPAMAQSQTAQTAQAQPPDATAAAPATTAPAPQAATTPQPEVPAPPPAPAAPPVPAAPPTTDTAPAPAAAAAAPQAPTMTSNPVVQAVPDSTPAQAQAQAQSAADAADSAAAPAKQAAPRAHAAARPAEPVQRAQTETRTAAQSVTREPAKPVDAGTTDSGLTRRDPVGLYTADGAAVAPAAAPAPAEASNSSDMERYWPVGVAGGVLLIGLAGYALTRRRREDEEDEVAVVVTPTERTYVDPSYVEAVAAQPVAKPARAVPVPVDAVAEAEARTLAAETPLAARTPAMDPAAEAFAKPISRRKRADSPEGVMLREGPLPTGEERAELLQRMMEAEPDEANPFHTPRARMRRARLILQAREKELREKATERFDWRTYKPSMKPGLTTTQVTTQPMTGAAHKAEPVK